MILYLLKYCLKQVTNVIKTGISGVTLMSLSTRRVNESQLAAKIKIRVKITRTNNSFFHTITTKRSYSCPIALPRYLALPPYSCQICPRASHMRKTTHGVKPPSHYCSWGLSGTRTPIWSVIGAALHSVF